MTNRARRKLAALFTLLLLAGLVVSSDLWLWEQRRHYTLNRRLITAVMQDDNKLALALVKAGANPNTRYRPTPVPSLFQRVQQLLHGSPPPGRDNPPALMIACGAGWNDKRGVYVPTQHRPDASPLVQALLEQGAKVNEKGKNGGTPLMWAVVTNRPETVRLLLEHGANVSAQHRTGLTALHFAILWDADKAIIRQLLAHGANPNLVTSYGRSPLAMAQDMDRPDIVVLLKQAGVKDKGK